MERIAFVTEPLLTTDFVQFHAVVPLLERLSRRFEVAVAAPAVSEPVRETLRSKGVSVIGPNAVFPRARSSRDELPSYIWSWGRDTFLGQNGRQIDRALRDFRGLRVNFSMTVACDADCWYIQSETLGPALSAMRRNFNRMLRWPATLATGAIGLADWNHLRRAARRAQRVYTSTLHIAQSFAKRSVSVRGIVPSPYRSVFGPAERNPSRDYVLSYLAKETDAEALDRLIRSGIPIKIFGSKSAGWVDGIFRHGLPPHVELLGRVSDEELRNLYSNALFTAFPFTEESFGLIPVESMACGTPVLSYRKQGPAETIVDGETGWLVDTVDEFAAKAESLFKTGYSTGLTQNCLRRASLFHLDTVSRQWEGLLKSALLGVEEPDSVRWSPEATLIPVPAPRVPIRSHPVQLWAEPFGNSSDLEPAAWPVRSPGKPSRPPSGPTRASKPDPGHLAKVPLPGSLGQGTVQKDKTAGE